MDDEKKENASKKIDPWSRWDKGKYTRFQAALKEKQGEHMSPLAWKGEAWVKIAMYKKIEKMNMALYEQ